MLTVTIRDLQYRYRRFLIGVLITALVFGIAFIFDGVKRAVRNVAPKSSTCSTPTRGSSPPALPGPS